MAVLHASFFDWEQKQQCTTVLGPYRQIGFAIANVMECDFILSSFPKSSLWVRSPCASFAVKLLLGFNDFTYVLFRQRTKTTMHNGGDFKLQGWTTVLRQVGFECWDVSHIKAVPTDRASLARIHTFCGPLGFTYCFNAWRKQTLGSQCIWKRARLAQSTFDTS